jgi:release factor glutamine methyltransferase
VNAIPGSVRSALDRARALGLGRLDAQLLLAHCLQRPRPWLIAHDSDPLAEAPLQAFLALARRRAGGEPLAYLVGTKEFHGLTLEVGPAVLVPRPDTETLVDWAIELLAASGPFTDVGRPRVVDLGTGSGAIALAIGHACPHAAVTAIDASPDALAVARRNGERLGVAVEWLASDWWSALDGRRFELIVGNPPYVRDGDAHLRDLAHEPLGALAAGPDGLRALRAIVAGARAHAAPSAWLVLEHGFDQADAVRSLLAEVGGQPIVTRTDLAGQPRCTAARL